MDEHKEYKDYKDIDLKEQKAKSFIKLVMIAFDYFYPDSKLTEEGVREKVFIRFKLIESIHKIKSNENEDS